MNCGECLMSRVVIQPLEPDGSCPHCQPCGARRDSMVRSSLRFPNAADIPRPPDTLPVAGIRAALTMWAKTDRLIAARV